MLYGGDVVKWRKLANSMLLRAGMRLTKVNPTLAQQTVQKAVAGGLMESNADNCVIRHDANYQNTSGAYLNGAEANNYYLTANFVDYLRATSDPCLASIAARYVGAKSGSEQTAVRIDRTPAKQIGMPLGFDNGTIGARATLDGLASFYDYSQLDRTRMGKLTAPSFLVTYSQTQLLLAEAAHMQQMAEFDPASAVAAAEVVTYLQKKPFVAARAFEQINTQYWIVSFLNGPETWANLRRSGFPVLTPNPYPGRGIKGDFFRRLTYPDSEISVNRSNLQVALTVQGATANTPDTRVWWDK